jgi:hypothetical protein
MMKKWQANNVCEAQEGAVWNATGSGLAILSESLQEPKRMGFQDQPT